MTAMDYRQYDNALGRFHSVDALAEWMPDMTPYRFGFNNPVVWNDPSGLFESIAAARAYMSALGYSNNEYYISPDSSGNYIAYYHGQAFSGAIDADTFLGGELNTVTVGGGGGGGFLGTGFSTSEVLDVATDFMPGSGLKDIYRGWRDGNGWVVAMGVGFVIFDVATMGGGSVIRGTVKTITKRLMKNTARNAIKEVEEQVVKEVVAKTGGRLGNATTRTQISEIATTLESRGYTIINGGGIRNGIRFPEEYLKPLGGGRKGGSYLDLTATHPNYGTLRINTVDVYKNGLPTLRELNNATRIRNQIGPGEHLLLIPKI